MGRNANGKNPLTFVVLFLLTAVVTVAVFLLFVPADARGPRFALTLATFLFAEAIAFGYPILMILRPRGFPYGFTYSTIVVVYGVGVLILGGVALTSIPGKWLLALHLIWFVGLAVGVGVVGMGGSFVGAKVEELKAQRAALLAVKESVADVSDRVGLLPGEVAKPLADALADFREALTYATSDSLPGSEAVDLELSTTVQQISERVGEIETACANLSAGQPVPAFVTDSIALLVKKTRGLKPVLDKRERLVAQAR